MGENWLAPQPTANIANATRTQAAIEELLSGKPRRERGEEAGVEISRAGGDTPAAYGDGRPTMIKPHRHRRASITPPEYLHEQRSWSIVTINS
jgi:hypothetical protein